MSLSKLEAEARSLQIRIRDLTSDSFVLNFKQIQYLTEKLNKTLAEYEQAQKAKNE